MRALRDGVAGSSWMIWPPVGARMAAKPRQMRVVRGDVELRIEIVVPHGLNVTNAARHLGVTRQAMSNLLNARAGLSADMAIRFEKAFGVRADTLLRMQTAYELAQARANEGAIRVERFRKAA